jgi:hypothetical protein
MLDAILIMRFIVIYYFLPIVPIEIQNELEKLIFFIIK